MRKGCLEKEKTALLGRTEHKGERERERKTRGEAGTWAMGWGLEFVLYLLLFTEQSRHPHCRVSYMETRGSDSYFKRKTGYSTENNWQ